MLKMTTLKDKWLAGIVVFGMLLTIGAGIFSFVMELKIPSRHMKAAEVYQHVQLLHGLEGRLRNFQRTGLMYLVTREPSYLDEFRYSEKLLKESIQLIRVEKGQISHGPALEAFLSDSSDYVRQLGQIVLGASESEDAAQYAGRLLKTEKSYNLVDRLTEFEEESLTHYFRSMQQTVESSHGTLMAVTVFEISVLLLIAFSGMALLSSHKRNKILFQKTEILKDRLNEKNKELEFFIRIASHDLRAPLVNIEGFANEIVRTHKELTKLITSLSIPPETVDRMNEITSREVPEAIHFINSSIETLDKLIHIMAVAAKVGQLPFNAVEIHTTELIKEILKTFAYRIREAGTQVVIGDLPNCIGDADQIRQIFSNLIDNAIKYREPTRQLRIDIRAVRRDRLNGYCLEDNGIGVSEQDLDNIFNLYHQLQQKKMTGQGIGLATVKQMVENNGGRIEVESEFGRGTRFWVWLPAESRRKTM